MSPGCFVDRVDCPGTRTCKGKQYSYAHTCCETVRLRAEGEFTFSDGNLGQGTFLELCTVR